MYTLRIFGEPRSGEVLGLYGITVYLQLLPAGGWLTNRLNTD